MGSARGNLGAQPAPKALHACTPPAPSDDGCAIDPQPNPGTLIEEIGCARLEIAALKPTAHHSTDQLTSVGRRWFYGMQLSIGGK